jgi:hypothetical protein
MLLTPAQVQELLGLIEQLHLTFLGGTLGADLLTDAERAVLLAAGIDVAALPVGPQGPLADSFHYGVLSAGLTQAQLLQLTYPELRQAIARAAGLPMSTQRLASYNYAKQTAAVGIRGLGNKLGASFAHVLIEADQAQRAALEQTINDETARAIALRQAAPDLSRRLVVLTGDSARDFGRIADFAMHLAFDQGRAAEIAERHGMAAQVYKLPYAGACPSCLGLLLEEPVPDGKPRLFTLSELLGNGSNIGRPKAEHKAVVGPQHPWCRCTLHYADPVHYAYDPGTRGWTLALKGTVNQRVRRGIKVS